MRFLAVLLFIPTVALSSIPEDVSRICQAVQLFGGADECAADYKNKQLDVAGVSIAMCSKFTYMVSINTTEFKNQGWALHLTNQTESAVCPLY